MSVSDPLLKKLKGHVLQFFTVPPTCYKTAITDECIELRELCETLENIFRKGLKARVGSISLDQGEFWGLFEALPEFLASRADSRLVILGSSLKKGTEDAKSQAKLITNLARARFYIRFLLQSRLLFKFIEAFCKASTLCYEWYEELYSILGNEILVEIMLSVCHEIDRIPFRLTLKNCAFLQDGWVMPVYLEYTLVPCKRIGFTFDQIEGHVVIVDIEPGSVAEEDSKLEPGDIIDETNSVIMYRQRVNKILSQFRLCTKEPLTMGVIKARYPETGDWCEPMRHFLDTNDKYMNLISKVDALVKQKRKQRERVNSSNGLASHSPTKSSANSSQSGSGAASNSASNSNSVEQSPDKQPIFALDSEYEATLDALSAADESRKKSEGQNSQQAEENRLKKKSVSHLLEHTIKFYGRISVGTDGRAPQIAVGINKVLDNHPEAQEVVVDLGEAEITVKALNGDVIHKFSYTVISVCGRRTVDEKILAFICGETTCSIAKEFVCYVFEANTVRQAKLILKAISQGFDRTLWLL